jgi:hypothetical protein
MRSVIHSDKVIVFWDVMSCNVAGKYKYLAEPCCLSPQDIRWRHQVPLKCWYLYKRLHFIPEDFNVKTACILRLNTITSDQRPDMSLVQRD